MPFENLSLDSYDDQMNHLSLSLKLGKTCSHCQNMTSHLLAEATRLSSHLEDAHGAAFTAAKQLPGSPESDTGLLKRLLGRFKNST